MRYKATIAYNGTNFAGWQIQKNATTIQEAIQQSMTELFKQDVSIVASGRTDAGVHALGQVIHFDLDTKIQPEKIPYILNANIDKDIQMLDCCEAKEDFHARYSAKEKTYEYKMYVSRVPIVDIGYGKHEPAYIKQIIEKKDRTLAGKTAPAKGLCLIEVQY